MNGEKSSKYKKVKEETHVLSILDPWINKEIFPEDKKPEYPPNKVIRYTDFEKKYWKINSATATRHLDKLREIGYLTKTKKGYRISPGKKFQHEIHKFDVMYSIQNCPVDKISSILHSYQVNQGKNKWKITETACAIYGLKKVNPHIEKILKSNYLILREYLQLEYTRKFNLILVKERKKIKDKKLKKAINGWGINVSKNILLLRLTEPLKTLSPKKEQISEMEERFKKITDRILCQFKKECPTFSIVIQF
jgi:hypothetical protein